MNTILEFVPGKRFLMTGWTRTGERVEKVLEGLPSIRLISPQGDVEINDLTIREFPSYGVEHWERWTELARRIWKP